MTLSPTELLVGNRKRPESADSVDPLKGGDIHQWAMDQAALLRAGRFDEVDILNVADEIEDLGRSDYRALESHIEIVLIHMLKWEHQPERRSRSWSNSIFESRLQIEKLLRQSPSLRRRIDDSVASAYADARRIAGRQMTLPLDRLPETCPYSVSQVLDKPHEVEDP